jgi:hypothetical protein
MPTLTAPYRIEPTTALSSNRAENDVHRLRTIANAMVDICFDHKKEKLHFVLSRGCLKHFPCQRKKASVTVSSAGVDLSDDRPDYCTLAEEGYITAVGQVGAKS